METRFDIARTADEIFRGLTKQLSGVEVSPSMSGPSPNDELCTLMADTKAPYRMEFTLTAERSFLYEIAEKMKRNPPLGSEAEVENYLKEYFNIICGRIVSSYNNSGGQSARIGIVRYQRSDCPERGCAPSGGHLWEYRYEAPCGRAILHSVQRDVR